jgi:hypothetical protein
MSTIIERAAHRNAYIVFIDEAGFMCDPLSVKSWAPKGHPPVLRVSTPHERISVAGAITVSPVARRYGFFYEMLADNQNYRGSSIGAFLEQLWQHVHHPMTILWDSIPIHFRSRSISQSRFGISFGDTGRSSSSPSRHMRRS